jgi:acyl-CoA thioester hydrolase
MEENGIWLPVKSVEMDFRLPVEYDEAVQIHTEVTERPTARIRFAYRIFNEAGQLAVSATTELVFLDAATGKPRRAPEGLVQALGF